jgi:hypothetical protein
MNTILRFIREVATDKNAQRIISTRNRPIFNCTPLLEIAVRSRILNSEKYTGAGSCFLNGTEMDPT